MLKETSADITVGDDIEQGEGDGFAVSGYREMCARQEVQLVNLREGGFIEQPGGGKILKNLYISKIVREAVLLSTYPSLKHTR